MMMMSSSNRDARIVGGSTAVAEDKDNKDHGRSWEEQEDLMPDDST